MSHINVYTVEDVLALNSMIDLLKYNVKYFDVNHNRYFNASTIDSNGFWRLCSTEEIRNVSIVRSMHKFINFLSSFHMDIPLTYLIYKVPLENVPLYINKTDNLELIARWRLQIGK